MIVVSHNVSSEDVYSDVLEFLKRDSGGVNDTRILFIFPLIFSSEHASKLICPKATLENT